MDSEMKQRIETKGEQLVRDGMNFHPNIPLTPKYQALADAIDTALRNQHLCRHCECVCVDCEGCGSEVENWQNESSGD